MKTFTLSAIALCINVALFCGGCSNKAADPPTTSQAPGPTTLTQAQADEKIKSLENNKDIPPDAKKNLIEEVRSKVK